jgi:hypothetical protein
MLHEVGDFFGRAEETVARCREVQSGLTQRQAISFRDAFDPVGMAAIGVRADIAEIRKRRIKIVAREIVMAEGPAELL